MENVWRCCVSCTTCVIRVVCAGAPAPPPRPASAVGRVVVTRTSIGIRYSPVVCVCSSVTCTCFGAGVVRPGALHLQRPAAIEELR